MGGGGCVAHCLVAFGVFGNVAAAKKALNDQIDPVHAELAAQNKECPRVLAGVEDDYWHSEVIKAVVTAGGFHYKKQRLNAVNLAALVAGGRGLLIDGVLNAEYEDEEGCTIETDPTDVTGPRPWQPGGKAHWRHAIAVVGGSIIEQQQQQIDARCLHLDPATGVPDRRGYMYNILKVYVVEKCRGALGCKGACLASA